MARRGRGTGGGLGVILILIGIPVFIVMKSMKKIEDVGPAAIITGVVLVGIVIIGITVMQSYLRRASAQKRRESLLAKYGDPEIVDQIMGQLLWVGATEEQLTDSIGRPHGIDVKIMKKKRRETWKYFHRGGNRYGLRVTIEDGIVVGCDKRL
jgi:hypothetical protein